MLAILLTGCAGTTTTKCLKGQDVMFSARKAYYRAIESGDAVQIERNKHGLGLATEVMKILCYDDYVTEKE